MSPASTHRRASASSSSRAASGRPSGRRATSATASAGPGDLTMDSFLSYTFIGLFTGAAYAIAASGLVLTYSTTRVFNIAHGAVGMVFAFLYWDFSVRQGVPVWLSLILVLGVIAPLTGVFMQRVVTRGLGNAPIGVSLVVTVGILVTAIGLAQNIWKPAARSLPQFFPDHLIKLGSVVITWQQ